MNNRQNGRRRRGGGGNTPRPMGMAQGSQGGNRLEIRVRGNAHQLLEKYKVLARDAHQAGDRVAAEYYLQHADHYFRVLNDSRIRQEEMRARRGIFDPLDDDTDDEDQGADMAETGAAGEREGGENEGFGSQGQREERRPRLRDNRRFDERQGRDGRSGQGGQGRRPDREFGLQGEALEAGAPEEETGAGAAVAGDALQRPSGEISDGEAALVAFGGPPLERASAVASDAETGEAPAPRRRPRVRRTAPAPAEG